VDLYVDGVGGTIQPGKPARRPDCTLTIDTETLAALIGGTTSIIDAYLDGLVDIDGELVAAVQVGSALLRLAG
jgi:hypothetical protein